jgi:hypothetical protein
LVSEAHLTLQAIRNLGKQANTDPWTDPANLAQAVKVGILDSPQLSRNPFARGQVRTRIEQGACVVIDPDGAPISEAERLKEYLP